MTTLEPDAYAYIYSPNPPRLTWLQGGPDIDLAAAPPTGDGFLLGTTQPVGRTVDAVNGNAGCRKPDAQLAPYDGSITNNPTPGKPITGLLITGIVDPTASGLWLQDCVIAMGASTAPTGSEYPAWRGYRPAVTDGLAEFCTVRPSVRTVEHYGPCGAGFTWRRCDITGVVDGFHVNGINGVTMKARLEGSHVHDLPTYAVDPRQGGGVSHNDGVQAFGLLELDLVGNRVDGGQTSAVLIQQQSGAYRRVLVDSNWLYGKQDAGTSALNASENGRGPINNFTVTNNRFGGKTYSQLPGTTIDAPTTVIAGNTNLVTGAPMTFTRV